MKKIYNKPFIHHMTMDTPSLLAISYTGEARIAPVTHVTIKETTPAVDVVDASDISEEEENMWMHDVRKPYNVWTDDLDESK